MEKSIEAEIKKNHFRVAIFGSARIKKDDEIYKCTHKLASDIGMQGIDIVTGGGPGIMEAANSGHKAGVKKAKNKADSIGLPIRLPWEAKVNEHLDIKKQFNKFSGRLDEFMTLSNMVIIMPGGIGTCLELFYTWQLTQVKHICNIPILLQGKMWQELIKWVEKYPLKKGLISPGDMKNIHNTKGNSETLKMILKARELFEKLGDKYCLNWKKYKLD